MDKDLFSGIAKSTKPHEADILWFLNVFWYKGIILIVKIPIIQYSTVTSYYLP